MLSHPRALGAAFGMLLALLAWVALRIIVPQVRGHIYDRFKRLLARPDAERRPFDELSTAFAVEHERAINLQTEVQIASHAAGGALALALVLFGARVSFGLSDLVTEALVESFDLAAVIIVALAYGRASRFRGEWMAQRSKVELLRQWRATEVIFAPPADPLARFHSIKALVNREILAAEGSIDDVVRTVVDLRLKHIAEELRMLGTINAANCNDYLARRARRQAYWFAESIARLNASSSYRSKWLLCLFWVSAVIALLKFMNMCLIIAITPKLVDVLSFVWFICLALSGFLVGTLVSQNLRGTRHRYDTQRRHIADWLSDEEGVFERGGAAPDSHVSGEAAQHDHDRIIAAVMRFERLMGDELIDWLRITQRESFELSIV